MTKNNPGPNCCYAKAEPDEPMFVLLGRDPQAPGLVWLWACLRELHGESPVKLADARRCCAEMVAWAAAHGRPVCGLGQSVLAGVFELIRTANYAVKEGVRNAPTEDSFLRMILANTPLESAASAKPTDADRLRALARAVVEMERITNPFQQSDALLACAERAREALASLGEPVA